MLAPPRALIAKPSAPPSCQPRCSESPTRAKRYGGWKKARGVALSSMLRHDPTAATRSTYRKLPPPKASGQTTTAIVLSKSFCNKMVEAVIKAMNLSLKLMRGIDIAPETFCKDFLTLLYDDNGGNMHAAATGGLPCGRTAPGGGRRPAARACTIYTALASGACRLPALAGKLLAGTTAARVQRIAFGAGAASALGRGMSADPIGAPTASRNALVTSCSWKELRMPSPSGADPNGLKISGNSSDFPVICWRGTDNGARPRPPALGVAPGTGHGPHVQIRPTGQPVMPLRR